MSTKHLIQQGGRLGRYQLITRLATGGMAEVWLARATGAKGFQKTIVVKTILPHLADDPDFLNMFINEALLAAALNHPNIVQIFDLGQIGERYFIAMEFIVGRTMRQIQRLLRKKHKVMPVWLVLRVMVAVCDALDYAHNRRGDDGELLGIVHRDITPENIMISFSGVTKVVDFGIAKATTSAMITQGGKIKGKLSYLAPEQIIPNGKAQVDRRTDIYALGVVLYEMLTGVRPFRASNDIALLLKIPKELPTAPSEIARWVPTRLSDIVMRALEKNPEKRFQSGRELGADLEGFLTSVGMYPTERQVSEYMCKLFDEEERKVIATGSLAAKAVGKDSFEISSGSDIKGPDSAGSITVDIPDSALVSTSVSESLDSSPTDPKAPLHLVKEALRDSGVQLASAVSEGDESPKPPQPPPSAVKRIPSQASPPPLPPDAVGRDKKQHAKAMAQSAPIVLETSQSAGSGAASPAESGLSQRTESDIALDMGDPTKAEIPSIEIEVPALDAADLAGGPDLNGAALELPSVEVPPPEAEEIKPSEASKQPIASEQVELPSSEVASSTKPSQEVVVEKEIERPPSQPRRTVWSGRPTKSIAWDALVQRSMAEVDEENGEAGNELALLDAADGSSVEADAALAHVAGGRDAGSEASTSTDDELRESQSVAVDSGMSASHAWDAIVHRVNTEMTQEEMERERESGHVDSTHDESPLAPAEPHLHMWDAFIRKRVSADDELSSTSIWGSAPKRETSTRPIRDDDPWSGSRTDPHVEAAAKFDEGLVLIRDGYKAEALRAWEQAVELWPDNKKYQGNLRLLRKATGGDEER